MTLQPKSDLSGEMSMEDILASIRKYVGEDSSAALRTDVDSTPGPVSDHPPAAPIFLTQEVAVPSQGPDPVITKQHAGVPRDLPPKQVSAFAPLEEAIRLKKDQQIDRAPATAPEASSSTSAFHQAAISDFLREIAKDVVQEWIKQNVESLAKRMIQEEIDRLRAPKF
jgi:cell pole-organizing protein PopZ